MHQSHSRLNNFDFLRIAAASMVLFSHQFALNGLPEPHVLGSMTGGTFGVLIFFSISGYLVSQSWQQDPAVLRFVIKRFLRIWPGLAVVTLLAALVCGPLISTFAWRDYYHAPEFADFLHNLKGSIRYVLPGVFENNIYPRAVNGSLWTIPLEVRCYIALLVLGAIGLMRKSWLMLMGALAAALYYFAIAPDLQNHQLHFGLYFFAGVCLDLFRSRWQDKPLPVLATLSLLAALCWAAGQPSAALLMVMPFVVIYVGTRSTPVLNRAGRFGDLSYGIYIYAFPVQQTVLWLGGRDLPFVPGLLICAFVTALCAFLSWHLVERPALGLKSRLASGAKARAVPLHKESVTSSLRSQ